MKHLSTQRTDLTPTTAPRRRSSPAAAMGLVLSVGAAGVLLLPASSEAATRKHLSLEPSVIHISSDRPVVLPASPQPLSAAARSFASGTPASASSPSDIPQLLWTADATPSLATTSESLLFPKPANASATETPEWLAAAPTLSPMSGSDARTSAPDIVIPLPIPDPNATIARDKPQLVVGPAKPLAAAAYKVHRVQSGETLSAIADRYRVAPEAIAQLNQLGDPDWLDIDRELKIPAAATSPSSSEVLGAVGGSLDLEISSERTGHVERLQAEVQQWRVSSRAEAIETETLASSLTNRAASTESLLPWQISVRPQMPAAESETSTAEIASAPVEIGNYHRLFENPVGQNVAPELPPLDGPDSYLPERPERLQRFDGYIWPAAGTITSGYGMRWGRMHKGIDIGAPVGTPIVAASSGEVVTAGWNSGGFGNLVKLRHLDGSLTLYAHNSKIHVRKGQQVRQGQQIAAMGSTGRSTGPHLHFEIHPRGRGAVNPIAHLPKNR